MTAADGANRTVKAHGTAVGLPSDADMGNSEVGHNALGSGQVVDQVITQNPHLPHYPSPPHVFLHLRPIPILSPPNLPSALSLLQYLEL